MITAQVSAVVHIRPDFWDLEIIAEERHSSPQIPGAGITVWESPSPERQRVVFFTTGTDLSNEHAHEVVSSASPSESGHLIVFSPNYEDGFDQALQDAAGEKATVTLLNTAQIRTSREDERRDTAVWDLDQWSCVNPGHFGVDVGEEVATCRECGTTSDMTRVLANTVLAGAAARLRRIAQIRDEVAETCLDEVSRESLEAERDVLLDAERIVLGDAKFMDG